MGHAIHLVVVRLHPVLLALALTLGVLGGTAWADAKATDAALAKVRTSEKERGKLVSTKATLAKQYDGELAEVDKIKKQKQSWRRDRKLRDKLASSLETANKLASTSAAITKLDVTLKKQRKALIVAIDAELADEPAAKRAKSLRATRDEIAPKIEQKKAKKIVLPDDEIDPLADPEDLEAQAKALRASESELEREIASLEKTATRFRKQAELRKQHERADELASRDDSNPRRTAGSGGRNGGDDAALEPAAEDGADELGGGASPPDAFSDSAVVLSDVVDGDTVDALRKAERSSDPETKAAAAERARKAVAARLKKIEKRRKEIEQRARELRDE